MTMTETLIPEWTLGDRLTKARKTAGLEQRHIAEACEVSQALVSQWERDIAEPRVHHLTMLAEATGVDPAWLLSGDLRTGSLRTSDTEMDAMLAAWLAPCTQMYGSV